MVRNVSDIWVCILFSLLSICIPAQNPYNQLMKDAPNGSNISNYEDGKIKSKFFKEDGNVTGTASEYYKNGQLKYIYHLNSGVFIDTAKWFYDNGLPDAFMVFKNDTIIYSEVFLYNEKWKVFQIDKYDLKNLNVSLGDISFGQNYFNGYTTLNLYQLGKINGSVHVKENYHLNGAILLRHRYVSNKKDGKQFKYNENGNLYYVKEYRNGVKNGVFENFNYDGELTKRKCYRMGKKTNCSD